MEKKSLIDTAYERIKKMILLADVMPGTLLSENELALQLNMSRTPIRTAISKLETEGFVSNLKNRGILVKEVSIKDIIEMFEVITSLKLYALDVVQERKLTLRLNELEELFSKQLEATEKRDYIGYLQNHFFFSREIVAGIHNNVMLQILDSFRDKMFMIAVVNYKLTPDDPHFSANKLNENILHAIQKEDWNEAKNHVKIFLQNTRERIIVNGRF
ncbi:MAG: GntR family transcriptional regulator [Bacillota bacterium]